MDLDRSTLISLYDQALSKDPEADSYRYPAYTLLCESAARYERQALVGEGALKKVWCCLDHQTQREVAYATLHARFGKEFYDDLIHEAWLTGSLQHPNIIKVYDVGLDDEGRPFFTMDLKANQTLVDAVQKGLPSRVLLEIFLKVCDAMSHAHRQQVIHLDLKPENIQCGEYNEVLVCDWGIAKLLHGYDEESLEIASPLIHTQSGTLYGQVKGTLGFMAPEQVNQEEKAEYTDIYALGCMLYFILTGEAPYSGSEDEMLSATRKGLYNRAPLQERKATLSPSLLAVIEKALAPEPQRRYSTVEEMRNDVSRYLQGSTTQAEQASLGRELALFGRKHPRAILASMVAVILGIGSLLTIVSLNKERNTHEQQATVVASELETIMKTAHIHDLNYDSAKDDIMKVFPKADNPVEVISLAQQKTRQGLALFKDNEQIQAWDNLAAMIQLDFASALANQADRANNFMEVRYILARMRPEYNFGPTERPTQAELIAFIDEVRQLPPYATTSQRKFIGEVIHYDQDARADMTGYAEVIAALLNLHNRKVKGFRAHYDPVQEEMSIKTPTDFAVSTDTLTISPLSYIHLRKLNLYSDAELNLAVLDQAQVSHLDLSDINNFTLPSPIRLPQLQQVTLHEKHRALEPQLRAKLNGGQSYQIRYAR